MSNVVATIRRGNQVVKITRVSGGYLFTAANKSSVYLAADLALVQARNGAAAITGIISRQGGK